MVAVAPFARGAFSTRATANKHTPQFELLKLDSRAGRRLAAEVFSGRPPMISVPYLSRDGDEVTLLRGAAIDAGYRVAVRVLDQFPFVTIDRDWQSYRQGLSRNLRRDVDRCSRRVSKLGPPTLDVRLDTTLVSEAWSLEMAGWKGSLGTAIAAKPQTERFYREVAEWAASRGSLRLCFLRVGGTPMAFHLAVEENGAYLPLKGGFDPRFGAYSPGKLIIEATLKRAFAIGLKRYEFLGGADPYKLRWATGATDRVLFQAFAPSAAGVAARVAFVHGRPLAKRMRNALLTSRAKALRARANHPRS
ncbi:MAG: GNAT family N-acetyltransferase [Solirubrobacterales bacterium]|nr:GNAT family N-acetyltransferase [Solirubrobacterales bacterium]